MLSSILRDPSHALWRNKGRLTLALFLLALPAAPARAAELAKTAQSQPAQDVDERPCRSRDAHCQGYVAGILDSLRIAGNVCLPDAVPGPRVEFIVRDWLALNPTLVSQAGAELIANALRKSFPCK